MADYSHILFNKAPSQLRLLGARGGKAYGRNQRARRALIALLPVPPIAAPPSPAPRQTTAEAIAVLDAQFPWLRRAESKYSLEFPAISARAEIKKSKRLDE